MSENPFSPMGVEAEPQKFSGMSVPSVLREILKYVGAYLLGIVSSIALTPAEMNLGGAPLWLLYPVLAPIGFFLFYGYLEGAYLPFGGKGFSYWLYCAVGLVPFAIEPLAYFLGPRSLLAWRPLWIGFPMGYVGTLGVYYTAAASI